MTILPQCDGAPTTAYAEPDSTPIPAYRVRAPGPAKPQYRESRFSYALGAALLPRPQCKNKMGKARRSGNIDDLPFSLTFPRLSARWTERTTRVTDVLAQPH